MTAQDLKNSILQQAIQGKLLPQNPNDEPASELLKKISAERQRLIDEGKIKNPPQLPPISDDEKPFNIPESWQWVRLGELYNFIDYRGKTPTKISQGIPLITAKNVKRGYNDYSVKEYISQAEYDSRQSRGISHKGDILFTTEAPLGHVSIADLDIFSAGQRLITLQAYDRVVCNKIIMFFILSESFQKMLIAHKTGTTVSGIKSDKLKKMLIPIPPLAEQKRIVEKLEEILPLIERYGELEQRLTKLDKEFPDKLKKSLLQQAIQGKLTRQLSTDGNAKDLLEKIRAEKLKFIEEGKIKKEKPLPPISAEEIPFDIPENWQWVRLGEICTKLVDGTHKTPHYTESGVKFLSVKNMSTGKIDFSFTKFISTEEHEILYKRCDPKKGDMLLSKVGTTGVPAYVDTDEQFSLFVSIALLRFNHDFIVPQILYNWIYSPLVQRQAAENTKGIGNKNWVLDKIATTFFPLPPLAEQKRIVKRLEELLPLCDRLREKFLNVQ